MTFYNDNDRFAAAWLRELIAAGHVSNGIVDERSIADLGDLAGYNRVHLFAGIGGWDYALKLAGWPDDLPVWTGSCPCQPFSQAGRRLADRDARHLWPEMLRLIVECRPPVVFGEQVASRAGRTWLAGVRSDLEALGYAVGAADLCAASVGAPHIRQRLFWVADRVRARFERPRTAGSTRAGTQHSSGNGNVADDRGARAGNDTEGLRARESGAGGVSAGGSSGRLADEPLVASPWGDFDVVWCDERPKRGFVPRRTQSGVFPLAPRLPGRVGILRGAGNSIVPQVAAAFVRAYMGCAP